MHKAAADDYVRYAVIISLRRGHHSAPASEREQRREERDRRETDRISKRHPEKAPNAGGASTPTQCLFHQQHSLVGALLPGSHRQGALLAVTLQQASVS